MLKIRVLIVEDDPMVREIHRKFIGNLEGFFLVGEAGTGVEALKILETKEIDLIILDIFMPEMDGIKTFRALRSGSQDVDVIVITAAQSGDVIKEAARLGAYDYLIKPFNFDRFKYALESYSSFYRKLEAGEEPFTQAEVNGVFRKEDENTHQHLPKGLQPVTLKKVIRHLEDNKKGLSSEETAVLLGVSRVTARRYLEYLVAVGKATIEPEYKEWGRPTNKYRYM